MRAKHSLLVVALFVAGLHGAFAQSSYSIPNPLVKPSSMSAGPGVPGADMPRVSQVGDRGAPVVPPLPPAIGPASLPGAAGSTNAPGNESVIRDTLATFTVTAIVGNRAVLRNNVGAYSAAQATAAANAQQQGVMGMQQGGIVTSQPQGALPRQAVIRVKTDVPVYVAGVELVPSVQESRVEFRMSGRKQIVATVMLESQSAWGYVPVASNREAIDPAVATRVSPNPATSQLQNGSTSNGSAGSVPNGQVGNPR